MYKNLNDKIWIYHFDNGVNYGSSKDTYYISHVIDLINEAKNWFDPVLCEIDEYDEENYFTAYDLFESLCWALDIEDDSDSEDYPDEDPRIKKIEDLLRVTIYS